MHDAVRQWVADKVAVRGPFVSVLEVGSRNVNGGVRDLFGDCVYEGVDLEPGDGVDYVCDATLGLPEGPYDCVVSCEVFEHAERWELILGHAAKALMPGGVLIVTAAGPGRPEHSAVDGAQLRAGEWYANVDPGVLSAELLHVGFTEIEIDLTGTDVRAVAVKR